MKKIRPKDTHGTHVILIKIGCNTDLITPILQELDEDFENQREKEMYYNIHVNIPLIEEFEIVDVVNQELYQILRIPNDSKLVTLQPYDCYVLKKQWSEVE